MKAYKNVAYLVVKSINYRDNPDGVESFSGNKVYCRVESVTEKSFYKAKQAGSTPNLVLYVRATEYRGERIVLFKSIYYSVLRSYKFRNGNEIELTLEEKLGGIM